MHTLVTGEKVLQSSFTRKKVKSKFSLGAPPFFGNIVSAVTESFNSESEVNGLIEFAASADLGPGKRAASSAIQRTRSNIFWMKNHSRQIVDWLKLKNEEMK